ncbi:hypothetical protein [Legionella brunensis]|uniref:Macro domain-containing protein n=1 Tax=Legionella brunensis TaxID=29422 RepID=A0A0W0S207_9GAMM|nr:hypothetical protein [Legionella brunensis]KTC76997.1 hypothetical protein Lbru_3104 [Legionella brunensis]
MPICTQTTQISPSANSLIVCAGTVTCRDVKGMGAGFLVFKKFFNQDMHIEKGKWSDHLNEILEDYHQDKKPVPPYIRIAKQDSYTGGVATVPVYSANKEQQEELISQYKAAIKGAIDDAIHLQQPLYLQPLGIGVYGWPPALAAQLFAEVISEADPEDKLAITIPIHAQDPKSNDKIFEATLKQALDEKQRTLTITTTAASKKPSPVTEVIKESLPLFVENQPDSGEVTRTTAVGNKRQTDLTFIVDTLINNIETPTGKRWTSGKDSEKVSNLKTLRDAMANTPHEAWSSSESDFIEQIRSVCQKKRNVLHFWATPASVSEFETLLDEKGFTPSNVKNTTLK